MDLKTLRLVAAAARAGGFAAAARAADVDPSAVSRAVAQLESALGARLFHRTTRRLALTEAGVAYLRRLEPALEELDRAEEEARAGASAPQGVLRLTASVAFWRIRIGPLLPAFRRAYPSLGVEARISDANLDLVGDRIDLAFRLGPGVSGDVIATKLFETRYRVCASPDYVAAAPPLAAPTDLSAHRCLLFAHPAFRSRWLVRDRAGRVAEVPVLGDIEMSNALALRDAALQGLGPALLADWLIDADVAAGRLVDLFPDHDAAATSFDTGAWALYPSRAFLPAKTRAALDFFRAAFRAGAGALVPTDAARLKSIARVDRWDARTRERE